MTTDLFQQAKLYAQRARFPELLAICQQLTEGPETDVATLLDVGALLLNFGFITQAQCAFERAKGLAPADLRASINLANSHRDTYRHWLSRQRYSQLLAQLPNHPVVRRNALVSLEYDPEVSDAERLAQAQSWGQWATTQAGGVRCRPPLPAHHQRPLRVGYVSADFCQHTVGLFVKDVLKAHHPAQVQAFAYSAGAVDDWVTHDIRAACQFRAVAALDDVSLAALIRQDAVDVLVDLSGHTAGSRLSVFAHRPAPVQVSWLGYFATTGLTCIDAVLLDDAHAPPGTEAQFTEPVLRLPGGRWCYQPVPWAPTAVAAPPCLAKGHITFGCFNHTAKFNGGVFDVWAKILAGVPAARLVLKWRTFNDDNFCQTVRTAFAQRGIDLERIELRGPSFHADLLHQYADIDIALDPFPFTGGLTSCEALWMGVPVVTWPQNRVVSRQTYALLCAIGLPELAASSADEYVRVSVELAYDQKRRIDLRHKLRQKMQASPLMDVQGFTQQLENTLVGLYRTIQTQQSDYAMQPKTILHVGPGHRQSGAKLPAAFQTPEWQEIRLDIDPSNQPDIVGSMLDMAAVADGSVDALYSAHNIEHVYTHEVPIVLREFLRVLKPQGFAVITCPDLQSVCALVAQDKLTDAAYTSQAGVITPLDIIYGHGAALAAGHHYMAHKCGFTLKSLTQSLHTAGFAASAGKRRAKGFDLWAVATKSAMTEVELRQLAGQVLPD